MSVKKEKLPEQPSKDESSEDESSDEEFFEEGEDFSELISIQFPGTSLGLLAGFFLDFQGYQWGPVGQWFVRTLAGEGESILKEFSIRQRLLKAEGNMVKSEIQMSVRSTAEIQEKAAVAVERYISF